MKNNFIEERFFTMAHLHKFSSQVKSQWFTAKDNAGDEYIVLNGCTSLARGGSDHIYRISKSHVGAWLTTKKPTTTIKALRYRLSGIEIEIELTGAEIRTELHGDSEVLVSTDIKNLRALCVALGAKKRQNLTDEQREAKRVAFATRLSNKASAI